MQNVYAYLTKVVLISAIMYGYYLLALRNRKFHNYNRFYLLSSVFISLVLPFVKFDWLFTASRDTLPVFIQTDMVNSVIVVGGGSRFWSTDKILLTSYAIVVIALMVLFAISLIRIHRMRRRGVEQIFGDYKLIASETKGTPFSFFKLIFWNPKVDYQSADGRQILEHELVHVRQLHSLDKLIINLIQILFWFNPVFWLMKREINMVHEFLADRESLGESGAEDFPRLALQAAYPGYSWPANNNFAYSPIKRRLTMILKNNRKKVSYFGRIMVLPLAALVFMFFSVKAENILNSAVDEEFLLNGIYSTAEMVRDTIPGDGDKVFIKVEKQAQFPGGEKAWDSYSQKVVAAHLSELSEKDLGEVRVRFVVNTKGEVSDVKAMTMKGTKTAQLAIDAIRKGPKWIPAQQNGRFVNSYVEKKFHFVRFTPPKIVKDTEVQLVDAQLEERGDQPLTKVDKEAQFPGGRAAWIEYIKKNIVENINKFTNDDFGTAVIRFVVHTDGSLSNFEVLTMQGTNLAEVALNALRKGPKWIPAQVNGKPVTAYWNQPVTLLNPQSVEDVMVVAPPKNGEVTVVGYQKVDDKVFTKPEVAPKFPGQPDAWGSYLAKYFREHEAALADDATGSCILRFVVNTKGNISDVTIVKTDNEKFSNAVIEALKKGPKWVPAKQNDKSVNAYAVLPVQRVKPKNTLQLIDN
ncbi:MAG: energy transducer TonB [Chitinophagaceae bacterium]|nr:energy transducer TonB [Chitinophagaceae bacterium]